MLLLGVTGLLHNFRHIPAVFHVAAVLIAMVCTARVFVFVNFCTGVKNKKNELTLHT
jgi:hypothetical protein